LLLAPTTPSFVRPMHHPRRSKSHHAAIPGNLAWYCRFLLGEPVTPESTGWNSERTGMVSVQCRRFCSSAVCFNRRFLLIGVGFRACVLFRLSTPKNHRSCVPNVATWVPSFRVWSLVLPSFQVPLFRAGHPFGVSCRFHGRVLLFTGDFRFFCFLRLVALFRGFPVQPWQLSPRPDRQPSLACCARFHAHSWVREGRPAFPFPPRKKPSPPDP